MALQVEKEYIITVKDGLFYVCGFCGQSNATGEMLYLPIGEPHTTRKSATLAARGYAMAERAQSSCLDAI